jgi:hypothetical protein
VQALMKRKRPLVLDDRLSWRRNNVGWRGGSVGWLNECKVTLLQNRRTSRVAVKVTKRCKREKK